MSEQPVKTDEPPRFVDELPPADPVEEDDNEWVPLRIRGYGDAE